MLKKTLLAVTAVLILSVLIIPRAFAFTFKGPCSTGDNINLHCAYTTSAPNFQNLVDQAQIAATQNPKKYGYLLTELPKIASKRAANLALKNKKKH